MRYVRCRGRIGAAMVVLLLLCSASMLQATTIGYVWGGGNDPFDLGWINHLSSVLGHDVVVMLQEDGSAQFTADVLIISSDVGSSTVAGNYDLFSAQPMITTEYGLYDDLNITSDGDVYGVAGAVTLTILNPGHPLAAGLSGDVIVYSNPSSISVADTDGIASGVTQIALSDRDPGGLTIGVLEKGALDTNGDPAPGVRIISHGYDINTWEDLTEDGLKLLDAQVAYAIAAIPEPATMLLVLFGGLALWFRRRR